MAAIKIIFILIGLYEVFALGFVFGLYCIDEDFRKAWDFPPFLLGAYVVAPILLWHAIAILIRKKLRNK